MIGEAAPPERDLEREGELAIAGLLRAGVLLAAALLLVSLIGSWIAGVPLAHRTLAFGELFSGGASTLSAFGQLGLLALAVTPLARVALAAGVFARAGERKQALVAVGVLALLGLGFLLGAVES